MVTFAMTDAHWSPFYIQTKDDFSPAKGLFIELIDAIMTQKMGLQVNQLRLPWKRAQENVQDGVADFMIATYTPARKAYGTAPATPIYKLYVHLFTYVDHPLLKKIKTIQSADDIRDLDLTLAANRGDGWYQANIVPAGVKTHYANAEDNLAKFVAAKRADGFLDAALPTSENIERLGLQSRLIRTDVKFGPLVFHIVVSNKSPLRQRMDEIDNALREMIESGEFDRIVRKYDKAQQ